jgi:hypothetical protein
MATVLKRPSSAVLKKPSSSTTTRGNMAPVTVNGASYKIPKWISKEEALRTLKISVTGQGVKDIFVNQTVIENYHAVDLPVYATLTCGMRVKIEVQPNGCKADWVQNFSDDLNMSRLMDRVKKEQLKAAKITKEKDASKNLSKKKKADCRKQLVNAQPKKVALKYLRKMGDKTYYSTKPSKVVKWSNGSHADSHVGYVPLRVF